MVMSNVRLFPFLFFLCVFAPFANFYSLFSAVLWPPLQVFTRADTTVQGPGRRRGGVGETGWKCRDTKGKLDMNTYADEVLTRKTVHSPLFFRP